MAAAVRSKRCEGRAAPGIGSSGKRWAAVGRLEGEAGIEFLAFEVSLGIFPSAYKQRACRL